MARRRRVSWQRDLLARVASVVFALAAFWLVYTYMLPWVAQSLADSARDNFLPSPGASP